MVQCTFIWVKSALSTIFSALFVVNEWSGLLDYNYLCRLSGGSNQVFDKKTFSIKNLIFKGILSQNMKSSIDILILGSSHSVMDPLLVTAILVGCWPSELRVAKHDTKPQYISITKATKMLKFAVGLLNRQYLKKIVTIMLELNDTGP